MFDGLEVDLVTHDARKFFTLLLRKNGYVLEQLLSPLIVHSTPEHEELKEWAPDLKPEWFDAAFVTMCLRGQFTRKLTERAARPRRASAKKKKAARKPRAVWMPPPHVAGVVGPRKGA